MNNKTLSYVFWYVVLYIPEHMFRLLGWIIGKLIKTVFCLDANDNWDYTVWNGMLIYELATVWVEADMA